jgi:hypothetical protein
MGVRDKLKHLPQPHSYSYLLTCEGRGIALTTMATMSGIQSTNALVEELIDFCRSESLSEDGLREILGRQNNNLNIDNYE